MNDECRQLAPVAEQRCNADRCSQCSCGQWADTPEPRASGGLAARRARCGQSQHQSARCAHRRNAAPRRVPPIARAFAASAHWSRPPKSWATRVAHTRCRWQSPDRSHAVGRTNQRLPSNGSGDPSSCGVRNPKVVERIGGPVWLSHPRHGKLVQLHEKSHSPTMPPQMSSFRIWQSSAVPGRASIRRPTRLRNHASMAAPPPTFGVRTRRSSSGLVGRTALALLK